MKECNKNILSAVDLAKKLLFCADRGDMQREDDSCGVLFGMVRDSAYKIIDLAEKEQQRHIENGTWDGDPPTKV